MGNRECLGLGRAGRRAQTKSHLELKQRGKINNRDSMDSPDGPVVEDPPANAEDTGLIPGPEGFHICGATNLMCHNY